MNNDFKEVEELRYWVQKVLPLVYDDSLSYYELLSKIVKKLNDLIANNEKLPDYIMNLIKQYITSGAIGEVVRDILVDFMLNVKNPPESIPAAVGDGTQDDTDAIQGCIDYANIHNKCVYFPSGSYLTKSLTLKDNVSLVGFDYNTTRLVLRGGATAPLISGNTHNNTISGLTLDGNMDIQINNMNVLHLTGGKYNLSNLWLTDGYDLIYLNIDDDCMIFNCNLDKAVINGCTVVGEGNLVINGVVVNELSELSGKYALNLGVNNALVTNLYSNAKTHSAINVTANNCYISAKVVNTNVDYIDSGNNNSFDIRGNSSKEVLSYQKVIKAKEMIIDVEEPLGYKKPENYNEYFKTVPFKNGELIYDVIVKGETNIATVIQEIRDAHNQLNQALAVEVQNRVQADEELHTLITESANNINTTISDLRVELNEEIVNREQGVSALTESLNTFKADTNTNFGVVNNKISELEQGTKRNVLFVCDSFGTGDTATGKHYTPYPDLVETYINKTGKGKLFTFYKCAKGGTSFADTNPELTFLQQLKDWEISSGNTIEDKNDITDILIFSGGNDRNYTVQQIQVGINAFCDYCRVEYPNATVQIGVVGTPWYNDTYISIETMRSSFMYLSGNGFVYANGTEGCLYDTAWLSDDKIHPNELGQSSIAQAITSYLVTGKGTTGNELQEYEYLSTGLTATVPMKNTMRQIGDVVRYYSTEAFYNYAEPQTISCDGKFHSLGTFIRTVLMSNPNEPLYISGVVMLNNQTNNLSYTVPCKWAFVGKEFGFIIDESKPDDLSTGSKWYGDINQIHIPKLSGTFTSF